MGIYEEKVELLRNVDIFSQLLEYELDIIARYSDMVHFKKKEVIFSHGTPADKLYVLEKGRVGIISIKGHDEIAIAQIIPGESFGEIDFLERTPRSAIALAEEDTRLLQFPAKKYKTDKIFNEHTYIFARLLYRLYGMISERIWRVNNMLFDKTRWLYDLHKQLLADKMTGLYNQTFLKEDFVKLLPMGDSAALLMIKPDNFKEVNDNYGHEAGDNALNLMAIFLQSELGENDIGVRYHGDEFCAILPFTDRDMAIHKAREIGKTFYSIDLSGIIGSNDFRIRVSIGIAFYPGETDNSKSMIELAYERVFKARNKGGNRIVI